MNPKITNTGRRPVTGPNGDNPISDDQIRRLKRMTIGLPTKSDEDRKLIDACDTALRPTDRDARRVFGDVYIENTKAARARCAEIINARAKETP